MRYFSIYVINVIELNQPQCCFIVKDNHAKLLTYDSIQNVIDALQFWIATSYIKMKAIIAKTASGEYHIMDNTHG